MYQDADDNLYENFDFEEAGILYVMITPDMYTYNGAPTDLAGFEQDADGYFKWIENPDDPIMQWQYANGEAVEADVLITQTGETTGYISVVSTAAAFTKHTATQSIFTRGNTTAQNLASNDVAVSYRAKGTAAGDRETIIVKFGNAVDLSTAQIAFVKSGTPSNFGTLAPSSVDAAERTVSWTIPTGDFSQNQNNNNYETRFVVQAKKIVNSDIPVTKEIIGFNKTLADYAIFVPGIFVEVEPVEIEVAEGYEDEEIVFFGVMTIDLIEFEDFVYAALEFDYNEVDTLTITFTGDPDLIDLVNTFGELKISVMHDLIEDPVEWDWNEPFVIHPYDGTEISFDVDFEFVLAGSEDI